MKLLIDDADIEKIREIYDCYPVDGVTTNPSILAKAKKDPAVVLKEIREFIGADGLLFVQALGESAQEIIEDAHAITGLTGRNTIIKVPCIPQGYKAMRMLKEEGIICCGTVVYTPLQAVLAAKAGSAYVAPYVNRIDNLGYDGVRVVKQIQDIFDAGMTDCLIIGASFKNCQQVLELYEYGIDSCTCTPDIFAALGGNPTIDKAVSDFEEAFFRATGKRSMKEAL